MKTSKEMQLKIIDKMRENVENGKVFYSGLQFKEEPRGEWVDDIGSICMDYLEYRVKPETIMLSSVEIPKPLEYGSLVSYKIYYHVVNGGSYWGSKTGAEIADEGIRFIYETKEEAIEASKLLFRIKQCQVKS